MSALPRSRPFGRRARLLAGSVAAGAVVLTTALASTTLASAGPAEPSTRPSPPERASSSAGGSAEARGYYDARSSRSGAAKAMEYRAASKASEPRRDQGLRQGAAVRGDLRHRRHDRHRPDAGEARRLPVRQEQQEGHDGRAQVRPRQPRCAGSDHRRPQDLQAQARVRRHRGRAPPVLDPAHRRPDGLRQRPHGGGEEGRPPADRRRVPGQQGHPGPAGRPRDRLGGSPPSPTRARGSVPPPTPGPAPTTMPSGCCS